MSVGYAEVFPIRGQASAYRTTLLGENLRGAGSDRRISRQLVQNFIKWTIQELELRSHINVL